MKNLNDQNRTFVRIILLLAGLCLLGVFIFALIENVEMDADLFGSMLLGAGMIAYSLPLFLPKEETYDPEEPWKPSQHDKNVRTQWVAFFLLGALCLGGLIIRANIDKKEHQAVLDKLGMTEQEYQNLLNKPKRTPTPHTPSPAPKQTKAPAAAPKATKKPSSGAAGSGVKGYTNFDDFYDDHYDDFFDIDEAEDYYYDHGGW